MTKATALSLLLCVTLALSAKAGTIEPARDEGRTAVRLDGSGRVVVALDRDDDGLTDRLYLFAPSGPVPPGFAPEEFDAVVEVNESALRVSSLDGRRNLRFLVADPREEAKGSFDSPDFLVLPGFALAVHDRSGLREPLWSVASDGIDLVVPAGSDCGGTDLDCTAGGLGSTGCETQCGGGGVSTPVGGIELESRRCGVSCASGYFSCCTCDAGGPRCRCRSISSVKDCPSSPSEPMLP
jgi:hypothetical protein